MLILCVYFEMDLNEKFNPIVWRIVLDFGVEQTPVRNIEYRPCHCIPVLAEV